MDLTLIISAFVAGLLTFLAPCTLPLVPGYLVFISQTSSSTDKDIKSLKRGKIFVMGLFYVLGFSVVFILLGSLFGLGGGVLNAYRVWLARLGGMLVIFFGLYLLGIFRFKWLNLEKHLFNVRSLKPGDPLSAFLLGGAFALGWTPCVGPILGAILTLAATTATAGQGALLLAIFSLGLGLPFLIIALALEKAQRYLPKLNRYLGQISRIGGAFLIFVGILLFTNSWPLFVAWVYQVLSVIHYDKLLDYL